MIINGSQGSLNLYFKGLLISSFPLSNKKTFDSYYSCGENLIYQSRKVNIKSQIKIYLKFLNMVHTRKKNKQPIYKSDHDNFLLCLFALMRLKIIENDESNGYLIMKKKKK